MINSITTLLVSTCLIFNFLSTNAVKIKNFISSKVFVVNSYEEVLGRMPSFTECDINDGKALAYTLLHSNEFIEKNYSEEEIVNIYYNLFFDRDADDFEKEFWKERITPTDTTILFYGLINSETYTKKCTNNSMPVDEYFIESGAFSEGRSDKSDECGLTEDGTYVFYATFGNSTYYHEVLNANV